MVRGACEPEAHHQTQLKVEQRRREEERLDQPQRAECGLELGVRSERAASGKQDTDHLSETRETDGRAPAVEHQWSALIGDHVHRGCAHGDLLKACLGVVGEA